MLGAAYRSTSAPLYQFPLRTTPSFSPGAPTPPPTGPD